MRFYGVSINSPEEGITAIDVCRRKGFRGLASIQVIYNILNKSAFLPSKSEIELLENGVVQQAR